MNNLTTKLIKKLFFNDKNSELFDAALNELLRQELEESVNDILKYELDSFLDYDRYQRSDNPDSRNGYYKRTMKSSYGELNLRIPRDRLAKFYTSLLPKNVQISGDTQQTILDMFNNGMTNSDIVEAVKKIYGSAISKSSVSNITNKIIANVEAFRRRTLSDRYAVIYLDVTMMALRRDTVSKEAVYIAIGINTNGTKEIIAYSIAPTESAEGWRDLLLDIKDRGIEEVALFCTDGLAGMEKVISEIYPTSKIQRCILHVTRNISSKVRVSDRKDILDDFTKVYSSDTLEEALKQFQEFKEAWGSKYPRVIAMLEDNRNLFTYYEFPEEIRSSIYTTNIIESFNKQLKRKFKTKEQFPSETSAEKYLVSQFETYNQKFLCRVHKGFGLVCDFWFRNLDS